MTRRLSAIVVALLLNSVPLAAQTAKFTVSVTSANVHKGPSTGSPIIGTAARGATLEVTRDLGSWVRVVWAKAPDKVGFVHVSTGKVAWAGTRDQLRASGSMPTESNGDSRPAPASPPQTAIPPTPPSAQQRRAAPPPLGYVVPPEHALGVGGRAGGPGFGIGVAARAWSREGYGLQVELSRFTPASNPGGAATVQLAPSVIFAFRDHVFDYWSLRPYVGAGPSLQHRGSDLLPGENDPLSGTTFGFQGFGGAEFTFASLPRFAVSADAGYRQQPPYAGADRGGFGLVVSGHWYVK